MDVTVTPASRDRTWDLTDLLGRSMGHIVEDNTWFRIDPAGGALETMAGMDFGPHPSLDAALAEIERHTRSVCRHARGQAEPSDP